MNLRMTGIVINQPDLPHWATDILQWLGMVRSIQESTGDVGKTHRELLEQQLETGGILQYVNAKTGRVSFLSGPASIYALYQMFTNAILLEANR